MAKLRNLKSITAFLNTLNIFISKARIKISLQVCYPFALSTFRAKLSKDVLRLLRYKSSYWRKQKIWRVTSSIDRRLGRNRDRNKSKEGGKRYLQTQPSISNLLKGWTRLGSKARTVASSIWNTTKRRKKRWCKKGKSNDLSKSRRKRKKERSSLKRRWPNSKRGNSKTGKNKFSLSKGTSLWSPKREGTNSCLKSISTALCCPC